MRAKKASDAQLWHIADLIVNMGLVDSRGRVSRTMEAAPARLRPRGRKIEEWLDSLTNRQAADLAEWLRWYWARPRRRAR